MVRASFAWVSIAACRRRQLTLAQPSDVRMVAVEGEGAKYWPVWRGPSGQGLVTGTYPDTWSATENVAWKKPVPGRGNSSPIVWGDRIFLTTAHEGGRRVSLIAFRRSDGTQLWEAFAPDGRTGRAHYKNGHASATASTDGTLVYASFGSRGLAAFDFNGKLVWHKDLGDVDNYHGAAGSPLLYKNRVILYQDFDGGSFVAAFDSRTGKEMWRTPRRASVGWGTPVAVRVGTRDEIIVSSQAAVTAYDPDTGRELWVCDGNSFEVIPTPVVGHGLVFASSGRVGPDARDSPRRPRQRHAHAPGVDEPEGIAVRAVADCLRRSALHGERHGEHRHLVRGRDRKSAVAGKARRRAARRVFGVARRGRRESVFHERSG